VVDAVKRAALFRPAPLANRAGRVGVTEVHTALNSGKDVARVELAAAGYVNGMRWATMDDERVRDAHADADGQTVPVGGLFVVGGERCHYPGDPVLSAGQRLRCRCYVESVRIGGVP
jgi:hypothetical protein